MKKCAGVFTAVAIVACVFAAMAGAHTPRQSSAPAFNPLTPHGLSHGAYVYDGPSLFPFEPMSVSHANGVYYAWGIPDWVCTAAGVGVVIVGVAVAQPELGAIGGGVDTAFCEFASTQFGQKLIYKYAGNSPMPNDCFWITRRKRRRLRLNEGSGGRYEKCIGIIYA